MGTTSVFTLRTKSYDEISSSEKLALTPSSSSFEMMKICLQHSLYHLNWSHHTGTALAHLHEAVHPHEGEVSYDLWVIGTAFLRDESSEEGKEERREREVDLFDYFLGAPLGQLSEWVSRLTGHFSVIRRLSHPRGVSLEVNVDRLCSFPLFYATIDQEFYLSDDALWLRTQLQQSSDQLEELFDVGVAEFLKTGQLVTGRETLFNGLLQLRAGEGLSWTLDHDLNLKKPEADTRADTRADTIQNFGGALHTHDWELYQHREDESLTEERLLDRLDRGVLIATQRLIAFAKGAPIVVPLSGGYDSRLVLLALKRLDYPHLITFTYGRSGNREARISQRVAQRLDVPWHFVEYTPQVWRSWRHSEAAVAHHQASHHCSVLPHIQDAPALEQLKSIHLPRDSVVACGHSGDLHAGSQLTKMLMNAPLSEEGLHAAVLGKYFRFNQGEPFTEIPSVELIARLRESVRLSTPLTREAMVDAMERWCWRERVAKFVSNSMRNYELVGLRWWLPLWDTAFTDLWLDVPLKFRRDERLYAKYVDAQWERYTGEAPLKVATPSSSPNPPLLGQLKRLLFRTRLGGIARSYLRDPMGWYSLLSPYELLNMRRPSDHINAHLARRLVKSLKSPARR